ncbi:thylakoid lumenal 15.0 kDa protein 2, chloroplastic-like isoform X1 [Hordeum vulgare subsp. vulgare]|uniref:thylakoid lumenal 15.0 kDa protein 2, chloroplastic-like isoform X1 n=1 Tax=Hordeum vulgare subsp. vulgare TaxID=112509 RepID=UPI001D1A4478|nr:thylakoid lumenal 15.0 kDa protein 2, chloroplastic-like isoform X1 [Hordeum vulgare subsp. vulgare]
MKRSRRRIFSVGKKNGSARPIHPPAGTLRSSSRVHIVAVIHSPAASSRRRPLLRPPDSAARRRSHRQGGCFLGRRRAMEEGRRLRRARAHPVLLLLGNFPLCFAVVGLVNAKAGVNKPELLPKEFTTVIDVAGFLSSGQENRIRQEIEDLEKDTGYKLRVLAQNYPDTPGLAIKDFWQVDDRTIVFVADPTFGNIINFNIGSLIDLDIPQSFWSRVAGKYGNMFYWKEKGEMRPIEGAVTAISRCLREPTGASNCSEVF